MKLNIVDGNPFAITNIKGSHSLLINRWVGRDFTITWEPCTEIYGKESRIRVLLSDDFGQTFKYVLADDLPNNGNCTISMPYIKTGKSRYHNWNLEMNGGCIKIEVKGEAAYDVYPKKPYIFQAGSVFAGEGWLITPDEQRVQFRDATHQATPPPTPYIEINSLNEMPEAAKLMAYEKKNPANAVNCDYTETTEGALVRRSWKATINGTEYTYTQLIKIPDTINKEETIRYKAKKLASMAVDLYRNKGKIGYPKTELSELRNFEDAFATVFNTTTCEILEDLDEKNINWLNETLTALTNIEDNDVIKPEHGYYYKIRSYVRPFGRTSYFYMTHDELGARFTADETEATLWKCEIKNDKYYFSSHKGHPLFRDVIGSPASEQLIFDSFTNSGTDLTLERGYSWGALTVINNNEACAQLHSSGKTFSTNRHYSNNPIAYCVNCQNGMLVSTDFQFLPDPTVEDPTPTDVTLQHADSVNTKSGTFTLDGRRLSTVPQQLPKGIYIINGKKVVK